jgi:4-diphosphocytidyl-2-C-methyl-D-erythritol kinase
MSVLRLKARAKINLFLHIIGRRTDNYHLLESLFAPIGLHDLLEISESAETIVTVFGPFAQQTGKRAEDNLVFRALELFSQTTEEKRKLNIRLHKFIPVGAGLGGGSSDAACILNFLNKTSKKPLNKNDLNSLALKLGADVPFFLHEQAGIVSGIGENFSAVNLAKQSILLIYPQIHLSSAAVYKAYLESNSEFSSPFAEQISSNDSPLFWNSSKNDLTNAAISCNADVSLILEALSQFKNSLAVRMSGSGSCCFAVFANSEDAKAAETLLRRDFPSYWILRDFIGQ